MKKLLLLLIGLAGTLLAQNPGSSVCIVTGSQATGQVLTASNNAKGCHWTTVSGTGDVLGPATNSANFFPQWNGANSKALKNGVVGSGSGNVCLTTNCVIGLAFGTGLPISTGVTGLAAGIATFLAAPSSANLLATMTTKTGTGLSVFGTGPTISGLTLSDVATGTQCLHANSGGVVSGTGSDCGSGGGGITIGTTTITSGTTLRILYDNGGVVGEYPITGTSNAVLSASPTLTGTITAAAYTGSGTFTNTGAVDFSGASSVKVRVAAGLTAATNGFIGYDSTNNMLHAAQSSADALLPQFTVTPTNGHCASWVVSGSNYKLGDVACPGGGLSGTLTSTKIPVATGSTTLGDSNLTQNADTSVSGSTAITTAAPFVVTYTAGGTTNIDLSLSNTFSITATTGDTTIAVTNPHGAGPYTFIITEPSTLRLITFPGSFSGFCDSHFYGVSSVTTIVFKYDGSSTYTPNSCISNLPGILMPGATSGSLTILPADVAGSTSVLKLPGGSTDFSATGGTSQVVQQSSAGAALTVGTLASTQLSDTANLVRNNAGNTYSTGAQDFGAATSLKIPVGAGAAPATNGFVAYDSTNNMLHAAQSSADAKIPQFTVTPANNDCAKWTVSGSNYKLDTAGAACGSGGGTSGGTVVSKTVDYSAVSGDTGTILYFNGTNKTYTLLSTVPTMPWIVGVCNINSTALTIARGTATINSGSSNISLPQYQCVTLESDTATGGNNYVVSGPLAAGSACSAPQVATAVALTPAANGLTVGVTCSTVPVPQNSQSIAYTTVLGDAGKQILHPTADNNARTFTIDSNANVAYPIGTVLTFYNQINTVTIAITSDTMYLGGTGTTGSRTLAAHGVATALKTGTTEWVISGPGLT